MNVAAAIDAGTTTLAEAGIAEPRREAASLLACVLKKEPVFIIAHPEFELTADRSLLFKSVLRRRAKREPFQYITGRQEFYGLQFKVTPDVLIPRPETEILVEAAVNDLSAFEDPVFLELGVGSGCISVAILKSSEVARGEAIDISEQALVVARENAETHGVADRLRLTKSDLFANVARRFDVIVSNPPYIDASDMKTLQPEVRLFEPHGALAGGPDGLDVIRRIVAEAPDFLQHDGALIIEIGYDQEARVKNIFDWAVWRDCEFLIDLQGIKRVVKTRLR